MTRNTACRPVAESVGECGWPKARGWKSSFPKRPGVDHLRLVAQEGEPGAAEAFRRTAGRPPGISSKMT